MRSVWVMLSSTCAPAVRLKAPHSHDLIRDRGHVQGIVLRMGVGVDAAQQFHPPHGVRSGAIPHGLLVQLAEERLPLGVIVARRQSARPPRIWFVPGWSRDGECAGHRDAGARGAEPEGLLANLEVGGDHLDG